MRGCLRSALLPPFIMAFEAALAYSPTGLSHLPWLLPQGPFRPSLSAFLSDLPVTLLAIWGVLSYTSVASVMMYLTQRLT